MTASLILQPLLRLSNSMVNTTWNFSTVQPLPLKIWLCRSCLTLWRQQLKARSGKQDCHLDSDFWRYWKSCYGWVLLMFQGQKSLSFYPKMVSARCKNCKWRLKRGQYPCHRDRWKLWRCPNQCQTHVQWCGASWKISSQQDAILISQLYEHWPFGASGCLLRIRICAIGEDRPNHSGRKSQLHRTDRKLWKYLSSFLCQTNRSSSWKIDLCVKWKQCLDRLLQKHMSMIRNVSSRWPPVHRWIFWSLQTWNALIFHLVGNDATKTKELMESLVATGQYQLSNFDADIIDLFAAAYADEAETAAEIKRVYEASDYIEDPHTAVASAVYQNTGPKQGILLKQSLPLQQVLTNSLL